MVRPSMLAVCCAQLPLARFLRFALMLPIFAALFGPASQGVHGLYLTLLRVRGRVGCIGSVCAAAG